VFHGTKIKKSPGICAPGDFFEGRKSKLLFRVALVEFLHTTCSIQQHFLTGVEWVRLRAHFNLVHWVGVAICPNDCLVSFNGGFGQKLELRRGVVKYHVSVVWMNIAFHAIASFKYCFSEMRHKDILLNKSDQMFVKDLLKITQNLRKNLSYLLLKSPRLMERMN
jgi:hypothetical protein